MLVTDASDVQQSLPVLALLPKAFSELLKHEIWVRPALPVLELRGAGCVEFCVRLASPLGDLAEEKDEGLGSFFLPAEKQVPIEFACPSGLSLKSSLAAIAAFSFAFLLSLSSLNASQRSSQSPKGKNKNRNIHTAIIF